MVTTYAGEHLKKYCYNFKLTNYSAIKFFVILYFYLALIILSCIKCFNYIVLKIKKKQCII